MRKAILMIMLAETKLKQGFALIAVTCLTFAGCSGRDGDDYPYAMKGLGVVMTDMDTDKDFYAGFVEGNYLHREEATASCGSLAHSFAQANHIQNYSYACCTVTNEFDCITKVR